MNSDFTSKSRIFQVIRFEVGGYKWGPASATICLRFDNLSFQPMPERRPHIAVVAAQCRPNRGDSAGPF